MTAVTKNLYIEQGATWSMSFAWLNSELVDGVVVPGDPHEDELTGATVRMQIRKSQGAPVLVDATTVNGKITTTPATGRITVKLSDEDTDLLSSKSAQYDLEVEDAAGDVYRLLQGSVTVSPNITQEGGTEPEVGP